MYFSSLGHGETKITMDRFLCVFCLLVCVCSYAYVFLCLSLSHSLSLSLSLSLCVCVCVVVCGFVPGCVCSCACEGVFFSNAGHSPTFSIGVRHRTWRSTKHT